MNKLADKIKNYVAKASEQIKSEQHNLMILQFFLWNKASFWNKNEVTHQAGGFGKKKYTESTTKTLNYNRVSKTIDFFYKKGFLINFSDLDYSEQKKVKRDNTKDISSNSYRITPAGEEIHNEIESSCLTSTAKTLLGLK